VISIITTFYNAERFLEANLRSVQSIFPQDMIEHILVDDGSTDKSNQIALKYVSNNVRLISNGRLGRASALNLAISKSKFRYLCILDADDLINPEWISKFLKNKDKFINSNINAAVFFGKTKIIDAKTINCEYEDINSSNLDYQCFNNHEIFFHNPIPHLGVIIDKDLFIGSNLYNEKRKTQLDWELWFRVIKLNKEFIKIDYSTGSKRVHADQFFEQKAHIRYLLSGIFLQVYWAYKIRKLILPLVLIVVMVRFFWGFLPSKFRMMIHKKIPK